MDRPTRELSFPKVLPDIGVKVPTGDIPEEEIQRERHLVQRPVGEFLMISGFWQIIARILRAAIRGVSICFPSCNPGSIGDGVGANA
jgi:hypothetical protein